MDEIRRLKSPPAWVVPAMGWFFWFLLIPLSIVCIYSFCSKGIYGGIVYEYTSQNYLRATQWIYLRILWSSLKLASMTAISCLMIGYPMAYVMATVSPWARSVLMMMVIVPFWTNFVVRAYAIKILFSEFGPMNSIALSLGLVHEPILFGQGDFLIAYGMVTNYLPFMVLPLYVALEKFDFSLLEAAKDLGATSWKTLWEVLIPLTKSGIIAGMVFVFTPALGEFVIPDLLGGARTMLIGNLITEQFLKTRDWPFGAALSLMLIMIVMVSLVLFLRSAEGESGSSREGRF